MSESEPRPRRPQEERAKKAREASSGTPGSDTHGDETSGGSPGVGEGPSPSAAGQVQPEEQASPRQGMSAADGQDGRIRELESRTAELESENSALQDELLRKAADFENFRKRMFRDKEEAIRYANAGLLNDVLPIIDDFERAIQSAGESKDFEAFHEGVSLIERQLVSVLERNWGLKRFSAEGEVFDPERHEAIAAEESEQHDDPIVLEEYQKGYVLHDRVLRPAKVKVAKPASPKGPDDDKA